MEDKRETEDRLYMIMPDPVRNRLWHTIYTVWMDRSGYKTRFRFYSIFINEGKVEILPGEQRTTRLSMRGFGRRIQGDPKKSCSNNHRSSSPWSENFIGGVIKTRSQLNRILFCFAGRNKILSRRQHSRWLCFSNCERKY